MKFCQIYCDKIAKSKKVSDTIGDLFTLRIEGVKLSETYYLSYL